MSATTIRYDKRPALAGGAALEVRDLTKRFGAVLAVDGVSLVLHSGEILALLGDNGAGKSTLIKCISGAHRVDEGEILLNGSRVMFRTPHDARRQGIETVYQDLALFDNLSIAANFFAGRERGTPRRPGFASWMQDRQMRVVAKETLDGLEVNIPTMTTPVGLLSGGQRQAIAVARAVHFATGVVILDEPTAALGLRETKNVQQLIKRLPGHGLSVLVISHNLEQVMDIADRAMVMRRGRKVGEAGADAASHDEIVRMIVGAQTMPSN
jgi:D-xylose transport system ATP-binding protein